MTGDPAAPRIAVIGAGVHARAAIIPSLAPAGLALAAVCARHLDRARSAGELFGGVPAFDDVEVMLDEVRPDGVAIVVPPAEFHDLIATCIRNGIPVFAEKPAADSAEEALALADLAQAEAVPLMVGYMKRFATGYRRAKEIATSPEFGALTLGSFTWSMGPFVERFDLRDWLFENPVHHFDLARFFFGDLTDVDVRRAAGHEHTVVVTARAASGAVVSIRANTTGSWQQRNEAVELYGDGHSLVVENLDTCIWRPPEQPERVWRPNYTVPAPANMTGATTGFAGELEHFRRVLTEGIACESDIASAAATLKVTATIAEQALQAA